MSVRGWVQNHPHVLEVAYQGTNWLLRRLNPLFARLGYGRLERVMRPVEELGKGLLFDCRMCGQCILHAAGMTCPMTCPKNLRNGPCGGVRVDGHCEVKPEMMCVWVEAYERSRRMPAYGEEIRLIQPPVNWQLEGSSAWVNMLTGQDRQVPEGWATVEGESP